MVAGVVLALVAVFLVKSYLDQQRQMLLDAAKKEAARKQKSQSAVLVAKQDIARGTVIKQELLETKIFPLEYIAPQAATSMDRVSGMVAVSSISKDEQITLSKLAYPRQAGSLADVTPVGKRAITISVDNISALAGMIKPGDYVDLVAMIPVPVQTPDGKQVNQIASFPLSQNVLVLAVGQQTATPQGGEDASRYATKEQTKQQAPSTITVALSPQEANLIAFVQEQAKIRMLLRSPADSQTQPLAPASWEALFQYLMPKKEEPKPEPKKVEEPKKKAADYVEIYRGLKIEKVPIAE